MKKVPYLHIVLFVLTFFSTLVVGAMHQGVNPLEEPLKIYKGFSFSATLLIILLSHEFSHYLFSKKHHVEATLPYFIPAPPPFIFGTMGAFIKMKSPITTKNALVDIGASGPIAGFIVSCVAAVVGLSLSKIMPIPKGGEFFSLGDSMLFSALTKLIVGSAPDNADVYLHPIAFAGWIGFFVTSLNLIPVGQLDGGHIAYAFLGKRHQSLSRVLVAVLFLLGVVLSLNWVVWAVLLLVLGLKHPPIYYDEVPLDGRRKWEGLAAMAIFILTFTPVPIVVP